MPIKEESFDRWLKPAPGDLRRFYEIRECSYNLGAIRRRPRPVRMQVLGGQKRSRVRAQLPEADTHNFTKTGNDLIEALCGARNADDR